MDRQERINKIKQFRDLAESRLKTSVYGPESYGLIKVLIGHVNELIYMLEPFPYGQFPAADPPPTFGIDPWGFYTETTVPHFNVWDLPELVAGTHVLVDARTGEEVKPEPTADEVHAHTKSCDFRRGLKVCSCLK